MSACLPLLVWAPQFTSCRVVFPVRRYSHCCVSEPRNHEKSAALLWLALLFYDSCALNFHVTLVRIFGRMNTPPDALSRLLLQSDHAQLFSGSFSFPGFSLLLDYDYRYPSKTAGQTVSEMADRFFHARHSLYMTQLVASVSKVLR